MFNKNILILLIVTCNISYGFENNTDNPQEPIVILTQRLNALDAQEKECRNKNNEKTLTGRNIATTGNVIGLTMFLTSSFISHKETKDALKNTGLLTCVGSMAIGFLVVVSDCQELGSIKEEKKSLAHQIRKLYQCPNVHAHPINQNLTK